VRSKQIDGSGGRESPGLHNVSSPGVWTRQNAYTGRSPVATTAANGRLEDFRPQLAAIMPWHPPNVIDCHRSAREGD
jgi:hypothetical protein